MALGASRFGPLASDSDRGKAVEQGVFAIGVALALSPVRAVSITGTALVGASAALLFGWVGVLLAGAAIALFLGELPWQLVPAATTVVASWASGHAKPMRLAVRPMRWTPVGVGCGLAAVAAEHLTRERADSVMTTSEPNAVASLPVAAMLAVAAGIAIVNGLAEETVWRHWAWRGEVRDATYVLSAASFATAHYASGLPSGVAGVVLSGLFGLLAAEIRVRLDLASAVWLHVGADIPIVVYLLAC